MSLGILTILLKLNFNVFQFFWSKVILKTCLCSFLITYLILFYVCCCWFFIIFKIFPSFNVNMSCSSVCSSCWFFFGQKDFISCRVFCVHTHHVAVALMMTHMLTGCCFWLLLRYDIKTNIEGKKKKIGEKNDSLHTPEKT